MKVVRVISNNDKQILIDGVIDQIKEDVANNDWTAVEELLWYVNAGVLTKFLPEELQEEYKPWTIGKMS